MTIRFLDKKELRNDRVQFTAKGAPFSTAILCAGPVAPQTKAIIANRSTGGQAGMNQIGELWVHKNVLFLYNPFLDLKIEPNGKLRNGRWRGSEFHHGK